jgi:hypothetical protein
MARSGNVVSVKRQALLSRGRQFNAGKMKTISDEVDSQLQADVTMSPTLTGRARKECEPDSGHSSRNDIAL